MPNDFEIFLQRLAIDTGSTHDLFDLWWLDIPTLSEYGQGLSKALVFSSVERAQRAGGRA